MTVLHSTQPATVYLSLFARVQDLTVDDVDTAMYDERSLVNSWRCDAPCRLQPRPLAAARGSASARVAATERARITKDVAASGLADDADAWFKAAGDAVLSKLEEAR